MIDINKIHAIDIHTRAEEPCGCHINDSFDFLQASMAEYFRGPWKHPATVPKTANNIAIKILLPSIFLSMQNGRWDIVAMQMRKLEHWLQKTQAY